MVETFCSKSCPTFLAENFFFHPNFSQTMSHFSYRYFFSPVLPLDTLWFVLFTGLFVVAKFFDFSDNRLPRAGDGDLVKECGEKKNVAKYLFVWRAN